MSYNIYGEYKIKKKKKILEHFDSTDNYSNFLSTIKTQIDSEAIEIGTLRSGIESYGNDFPGTGGTKIFNERILGDPLLGATEELPEYDKDSYKKRIEKGKGECKQKEKQITVEIGVDEDGNPITEKQKVPKYIEPSLELKDELTVGGALNITNFDLGMYLSDVNTYSLFKTDDGTDSSRIDNHNIFYNTAENRFSIRTTSVNDDHIDGTIPNDEAIPKDVSLTSIANDGSFTLGGIKTKTGSIETSKLSIQYDTSDNPNKPPPTETNAMRFILGEKKKKGDEENEEDEVKQFVIQDNGYIETTGALNFKKETIINMPVMKMTNALLNRDFDIAAEGRYSHIHDVPYHDFDNFIIPSIQKKYSETSESNDPNTTMAYADHGDCGDDDDYLDDPVDEGKK